MTTIEDVLPEHFELLAGWLSIPDINRWLTQEWRGRLVTPVTLAMAVRNKRNRLFLIRNDGRPCGLTALADIDAQDATAMVWYCLGESSQSRRGIVSSALAQLIAKAFGNFGLVSLYAWAMEDNVASIGVLRKVGFREVGRIRKAASSFGKQVDRVYFDLVPEDAH
jgi:[ribosomal protein S5]-alanine N-acetyltransferase